MKDTVSQRKNIKTQIKLTHQAYDEIINFNHDMGYVRRAWYPDEKDVLRLAEDPVGQLDFILWILKSNPEQKLTEEQKKVKKSLEKIVEDTIIFV